MGYARIRTNSYLTLSFGFNDGLSQPAVKGVNAGVISEPGEKPVRQGVVLLGREGDDGVVPPGQQPLGVKRPQWAVDGSFLAFRYLKQLVPEFNAFLAANALKIPFPPAPGDPNGAELLGARLVGRWKSGTLSFFIVLSPRHHEIFLRILT